MQRLLNKKGGKKLAWSLGQERASFVLKSLPPEARHGPEGAKGQKDFKSSKNQGFPGILGSCGKHEEKKLRAW